MHLTGGSRRVFRHFAWLQAVSVTMALSRPVHQQVTQAVGRLNEHNEKSMQNDDVIYIFWLYGWNDTGRFHSTEDLIRCDVTTENIHIESLPTKDISLGHIQKCDVYTVGGRGAWRSMIKLKVADQDKPKDVFIFPANPSTLANELRNGNEVNAFSKLINDILSKRDVTINPNPYYRNKIPKEWAVEELDAYTSPWVYYQRYRKKLSVTRVVIQIIVTVVVLVILVLVLALFVQYLTQ